MTVATLILAALLAAPAPAAENLIVGGDFEQAASGWSRFWSRSGEGRATIEPAADGSGSVLAAPARPASAPPDVRAAARRGGSAPAADPGRAPPRGPAPPPRRGAPRRRRKVRLSLGSGAS